VEQWPPLPSGLVCRPNPALIECSLQHLKFAELLALWLSMGHIRIVDSASEDQVSEFLVAHSVIQGAHDPVHPVEKGKAVKGSDLSMKGRSEEPSRGETRDCRLGSHLEPTLRRWIGEFNCGTEVGIQFRIRHQFRGKSFQPVEWPDIIVINVRDVFTSRNRNASVSSASGSTMRLWHNHKSTVFNCPEDFEG
jgi:hypothetical protein